MFPGDQYNRQYGSQYDNGNGNGNGGNYQAPNYPPADFPDPNGGYNQGYNGGGGDGYEYQAPQGPPPGGNDGYGERGFGNNGGYGGNNGGGDNYGQNHGMSFPGQSYAQNNGGYDMPPPPGGNDHGNRYSGGDDYNQHRGSQFPGQRYAQNSGGYNMPPPPHPERGGGYGGSPPQFPGGGYPEGPSGGYGAPPPRIQQQSSYNSGYSMPPPGAGYGMPNPGDFGEAPPMNIPVVSHRPDDIDFGGMNFPEWQQHIPSQPPQSYGGQGGPSGQPQHGTIPKYDIPQEIQNEASKIQLSNCAGRKRALLIGINYFGTKYKLRGCINDVHNIKKFIMEHFGFRENDMVILTDDQTKNPNRMPTHQNIIKAMKWLVSNARMNDSFFFHYSGHGSTVKCKAGDELDGNDETICPLDFEKNGQIIDDDMNAIMVRPLPPGTRLTAIFDCCHSASALDLPFTYNHNGKLKNEKAITFAGKGLLAASSSYMSGDIGGAIKSLTNSFDVFITGDQKLEKARRTKSSLGDVVMFSGCKDDQTSADTKEDLMFTGAMSHALVASMNNKPHQTYVQLLQDIRRRLGAKGYKQLPQLSTGRLMDMNTVFIM